LHTAAPRRTRGEGGTAIAHVMGTGSGQPANGDEMSKRAWRTCGELLMSAAAVAIVVVVLLAADVRVREQAQSLARTAPSYTVSSAGAQIRDVGSILFMAAETRSLDHGPVVVFVAAAVILVVFMARS
jgi:hypothetical protein